MFADAADGVSALGDVLPMLVVVLGVATLVSIPIWVSTWRMVRRLRQQAGLTQRSDTSTESHAV